MKSITKLLLAPCMAALLALTVPAAAQQQEGLINVNVSDIDVGVIANVQVPVAIAATVCGVAVNVLAEQLPGDVQCEADAETEPPSHCIRTLSDGVENCLGFALPLSETHELRVEQRSGSTLQRFCVLRPLDDEAEPGAEASRDVDVWPSDRNRRLRAPPRRLKEAT